jgi:hypothetical protein
VPGYAVKSLTLATWPDYAALIERHDGVFGGCWCLGFHAEGKPNTLTVAERAAAKQARVRAGRAHAALVSVDRPPARYGTMFWLRWNRFSGS